MAAGEKGYLVKLGIKSFVDGRQDICKDKESDLGLVVVNMCKLYSTRSHNRGWRP